MGLGAVAASLLGELLTRPGFANQFAPVQKNDAEWKAVLTPLQYHILREEGAEPPFSSPLLHEARKGIYACVGCELKLFSSEHRFDAGTGWVSFYQALEGHVDTKIDYKLAGSPRTEYHCARCKGHHGYIFKDGPKPTGLRYCSNGAALVFMPE